jgi:hypothetical protein
MEYHRSLSISVLAGLVILSCIATNGQAQQVKTSLGVNGGVGMMYLIEQIESPGITSYQPAVGMGIDLALGYEDSYFDLAVSYVYLSTRYKNSWDPDPWSNEFPVNNNALFFSLAHMADSGRLRLGYQFGFGLTREVDEGSWSIFRGPVTEVFPSAQVSGVALIPLNDHLDLSFKPMLIWSDVIGSFRYKQWNLRGEDVHFITQFGIQYNFVK